VARKAQAEKEAKEKVEKEKAAAKAE